jgi:hypothetical protein
MATDLYDRIEQQAKEEFAKKFYLDPNAEDYKFKVVLIDYFTAVNIKLDKILNKDKSDKELLQKIRDSQIELKDFLASKWKIKST